MNPAEIAQKAYKDRSQVKDDLQDKLRVAKNNDNLQQIVIASAKAQMQHREIHEPNVEVKNWPDIATPTDISNVAQSIKKLADQEAKLNKQQTEAITKAVVAVSQGVSALPKDFDTSSITQAIQDLQEAVEANKPQDTSQTIVLAVKSLEAAVNGLKLNPTIKVAPTEVNVPPVNLSGVTRAINSLKEEPTFDFDCYIAQDIDNQINGMQYVLLVTPNSEWCVIENNTDNETLRYCFGMGDYEFPWANRDDLVYSRLDVAVASQA